MKSLLTAKESVRLLFKHMTLRYAAERYPDVNITYQFIFTDIDDGYPIAISFRGGKSDYHEGMSEQPAVTIRTPSDIWLDLYLEPFLEGIRRAGTETEVIHLYEKNILPCRGCFNCWVKTPGRCVQSDDQRDLNDKLDTADLIVYAVPLYYHSVPGQVKNHLDRQIARMYPYFERSGNLTRHPRRVSKKQGMVLFSISGFPEVEQFDALTKTFEAYARHDSVTLAATVLLPGAMELYYNPTNRRHLLEKMDQLRSAGKQVVRNGAVKQSTLKAIRKIPCSLDDWRLGGNFYWYHELERNRES